MAETAFRLCTTLVLLIGVVAFLLLCLQAMGDFLRDLLSPETLRTVLRSVKRFRLRTLLGLAAVAQIFVAMVLWQTKQPGGLPVCLASLGCIFFVLWMIWACLFDTVDSLASSRLRRFGRARRITIPSERDRASTPLGGNESRATAGSDSQRARCWHSKRRA
jgi:hypothetical protein